MFTIKWCHDFVEELFHSVENVWADTNQASNRYGLAFEVNGVHHLHGADTGFDGEPEKGKRGVAFVMNEHGKTVASYHL
jgi:hypothetical protein